jgi:hypothetical protein
MVLRATSALLRTGVRAGVIPSTDGTVPGLFLSAVLPNLSGRRAASIIRLAA